jgi:hypothetical protein
MPLEPLKQSSGIVLTEQQEYRLDDVENFLQIKR